MTLYRCGGDIRAVGGGDEGGQIIHTSVAHQPTVVVMGENLRPGLASRWRKIRSWDRHQPGVRSQGTQGHHEGMETNYARLSALSALYVLNLSVNFVYLSSIRADDWHCY
jgi:hypothetical protein